MQTLLIYLIGSVFLKKSVKKTVQKIHKSLLVKKNNEEEISVENCATIHKSHF